MRDPLKSDRDPSLEDFDLELRPGDRIRMTMTVELTLVGPEGDQPGVLHLSGPGYGAWLDERASCLVTECRKIQPI